MLMTALKRFNRNGNIPVHKGEDFECNDRAAAEYSALGMARPSTKSAPPLKNKMAPDPLDKGGAAPQSSASLPGRVSRSRTAKASAAGVQVKTAAATTAPKRSRRKAAPKKGTGES